MLEGEHLSASVEGVNELVNRIPTLTRIHIHYTIHPCQHARVIRSDRGSVFYFCGKSRQDQRFPKYPPLPVVRCDGWESPTVDEEKREIEE